MLPAPCQTRPALRARLNGMYHTLCGLHPPTGKAISTSLSRLPALGLSSLARLVARHPSRRAMRYPAFQLIDPPPKLYDRRLLLGDGCLLLGDHRQQGLPICAIEVRPLLHYPLMPQSLHSPLDIFTSSTLNSYPLFPILERQNSLLHNRCTSLVMVSSG